MKVTFSSSFQFLLTVTLIGMLAAPANLEAGLFGKKKNKVKSPRSAQQQDRAFGSFFSPPPPSYELPYEGWQFPRRENGKRGGFFGDPKPSPEMMQLLTVIRARAEKISTFKLPYKFGGDHPTEGGLDCSGTMQFMLKDLGFSEMPRTSYQQYEWLKKSKTMQHSREIPAAMGGRKGIRPGDLIFWGGTYRSGHKVSHVMIYLGQGGDGQHYMFGARGKKKTGLNGSGVDIFKLNAGPSKSLIGYGSLPGAS